MVIKFWSKGDVRFRFLSNFYKSFIEYPVHGEPMTFPTAEHAYQAAKCSLIEDARKFTDEKMTPEQARAEGKRVSCKKNWDMEKRWEMTSILEAKFYPGGILAEELLKTGHEELVHYAPWDSFWGNGKDGNGLNVQGEILMDIRTGLMYDKKKEPVEEESDEKYRCPECGSLETTDGSGGERPQGLCMCLECKHLWMPGENKKEEKMNLTTVANKYHLPADWENDPKYVNIMRPSKWGNPHKVGYCTVCKVNHIRGEAVKKFAEEFDHSGYDLSELKGKILVCCCKPQDCHGDILAFYANGAKSPEEKSVKDKKKFPYGVGYYGEPHPDDLCHHCFKNDKEMANLQIDVDEICAVCKDCAVKHGYLSNLKEGVNVKWTSKAKQVFVFGSNTKGIHGAGQALAARTKWGAELGVGRGRTGNAYAIPTKIVPSWDKRQIDLRDIKDDVEEFLNYAKINHEIEFIVPRIGCGLAGYTDDEIGPMFAEAPKNVTFMEEPGFESWEKYRIKKEGLVVCGTGHRPDKLGGFGHDVFMKGVILAEAIIRDRKPDYVISGGALGWDQMLAMAALNTGAALHIYAPCHNQEKKWTDESKELYREILKRAHLVKYIHEGEYTPQCMKDRNIAMVEASHEVWALWNGDTTGGTAHCINFAKACKKGGAKLKILNFWKNW